MGYIRIAEGGIREGLLLEGFLALRFGGLFSAMVWKRGLQLLSEFWDTKLRKLSNFARFPLFTGLLPLSEGSILSYSAGRLLLIC